jgi:hypothetical protein
MKPPAEKKLNARPAIIYYPPGERQAPENPKMNTHTCEFCDGPATKQVIQELAFNSSTSPLIWICADCATAPCDACGEVKEMSRYEDGDEVKCLCDDCANTPKDEGMLEKATREKNERLNPKGLRVAWCQTCGDYCEVGIDDESDDEYCGNCEPGTEE